MSKLGNVLETITLYFKAIFYSEVRDYIKFQNSFKKLSELADKVVN